MNFNIFKDNFIKHISSEKYVKILSLYSEINFLACKWMYKNKIKIVNFPVAKFN